MRNDKNQNFDLVVVTYLFGKVIKEKMENSEKKLKNDFLKPSQIKNIHGPVL
jgi:hypothetical protein